jgi:hypothetical protein
MLAAATHDRSVVIAERHIGPKTNEVPESAPLPREMNERVSLAGHVLTIDAGPGADADHDPECPPQGGGDGRFPPRPSRGPAQSRWASPSPGQTGASREAELVGDPRIAHGILFSCDRAGSRSTFMPPVKAPGLRGMEHAGPWL